MAYRHVLCVYPYRKELGRDGFYPPLGLETIASVLARHAEKVDVVDLRREPGTTADFIRPDTDVVAFSVNWDRDPECVRHEIRSVPKNIFTMVGGRHASEDPERWFADCPNIDVLVRGDGEEIAREVALGLPLGDVTGLSYRMNGHVEHNPARELGAVGDDHYPDRALRNYVYTLDPNRMNHGDAVPRGVCVGIRFDTVMSSRGCPFNCSFCSFNKNPWYGKRSWSARSPESVVRELETIDADLVAFVDNNFTHDMDRVGAISDLIVERGIRKRYFVNARIEVARRPDVLAKMERAGFVALLLGVESATDATLRSMHKGFDIRRAREYFKVLRKSKMLLHGYFIVGCIGESEDDMRRIVPFARDLGLDSVSVCPLRHEPYSGLDEIVAANPGYHISPEGRVYSDRYSADFIDRLSYELERKFYSPGQMLRILKKGLRNGLFTPRMVLRHALGALRRVGRRRPRDTDGPLLTPSLAASPVPEATPADRELAATRG